MSDAQSAIVMLEGMDRQPAGGLLDTCYRALVALQAVATAAQAYKDAEVADDSHRRACKDGCTTDGGECDRYGAIWLATMKARADLWKALR